MAHKCDGCRYKGEHQEMMFRPMGVCNRGTNLLEAITNYEAEKCPYKKTKADRIRAMSDEELAEAFTWKCLCDYIEIHATERCNKYRKCQDCILEWLKQPAEGE